MFKKVLIANRGEIAVRIIRACREMGIMTVAVFSDADRDARHIRLADEAYNIGPPPASQSYLQIEKIMEIADQSGAEAIHPGYGFLSENEAFARACEAARIKLIGPSAAAMRKMGSKTEARQTLIAAGVPVVPGATTAIRSDEEAKAVALQVGFPVMLKAAAGGGGKGMRLVAREEELPGALREARSEAMSAFNDDAVYIEKAIANPHHIEIQILADAQGQVIHLGERECSIQRRHQKVIEEAPSPLVDADLRRRMGAVAIKVAQAAGYENAGTVEFLVDDARNFYFLEMNTRLQVEHPITEMVTGLDIVKEQIRIAAGMPLSISQSSVSWQGAALECRIYAEDPYNDFFPSPGLITHLIEPGGPGVRCDSGVYAGCEVPIYYDPLIAKLITYGRDRNAALAQMRRALQEYVVAGIKTNIGFFRQVLQDPAFQSGCYNTGFISEFFARQGSATKSPSFEMNGDLPLIAAAIDFCVRSEGHALKPATAPTSRWKQAGRSASVTRRL
ncbi:MAG: acetyl-CoA carboxylase biotin carboxylase subunit [Acidobacteria bacterium]|nr:acetyl-CoA carboxylase biotin carboxylase subunit [Acidobacteriota bacterium]MBI3656498.1 acetyl-CoA carboxylase biotin carboxylase subunit [Acidobacteriota bacterium]